MPHRKYKKPENILARIGLHEEHVVLNPIRARGGAYTPLHLDIGLERHEKVKKIEIKCTKISLPSPHIPAYTLVFILYIVFTFKLLVDR